MEELPEAMILVGLRLGSLGGIEDGFGEVVLESVHGEHFSRSSATDG